MLSPLIYNSLLAITIGIQISICFYIIFFPQEKKANVVFYFFTMTLGFYATQSISLWAMIPFFICLICYIAYKKSLYALLSIPIIYMILVICHNLPLALFQSLFGINYKEICESPSLLLFYMITITIFLIAITGIIKLVLQHFILHQTQTLASETIATMLIPTFCYGTILLIIILTSPTLLYSSKSMMIISMITITFLSLTLFVNYTAMKKSEKIILSQEQLKQFENLKEYTENLEELYNNIRSFKHDYINILTSISTYLDEKRYDDLKNYFETEILATKKILNHNADTLNRLMHIKQLEIKSLLSYKMLFAIEKGIQIHIDIPNDIESINMKSIDLLRILGIYLDNAIEATTNTKQPQLNLRLANMDTYTVIIIENSFVQQGIPIGKLIQKGVTTKGSGHGIGLYNANEILKHYPNVLHETYIEKNMFCQHLQIAHTK